MCTAVLFTSVIGDMYKIATVTYGLQYDLTQYYEDCGLIYSSNLWSAVFFHL